MKKYIIDVVETYKRSVEIKAEREDCRMDVPGNQGLLYEKIHFPKRQTSGRSGGYCV